MTQEVTMREPTPVPVTFVNHVVLSGFLNGNVNITLATAYFAPMPNANGVEPDLVISSRLRFDLVCAMQVRDALTAIIDQNTKPSNGEKVN